MYFAQLFHDHNDKIIPALGSDGVVSLDGRLSKANMRAQVLQHVARHKAFYVGRAIGYSLHKGNYSNNITIQAFERF